LPPGLFENHFHMMIPPVPSRQEATKVPEIIRDIRALKRARNLAKAESIGEKGFRLFPANKELLSEHAETALRQERWPEAVRRLDSLLALHDTAAGRDHTVRRLAALFVSFGQQGEARLRVAEALRDRPDSLEMRKAMAELILLLPEGPADPGHWRNLAAASGLDAADDATRVTVVAACVAGLRLAGRADEARDLLARHFRAEDSAWTEHLKDGFAKVHVFDNGRTRLEYYTKLFDVGTLEIAGSSQLAVTFDTMGQSWDKEPFAYKPLAPKATDFLSVRKRGRIDFHQDFSREEFLRVAIPIAAKYPDCVALGQSLGGYSALYYCCWLPGCRILASAPRNPQNPKYSGRKYARYDLFRHEYDMPRNEAATPTIVYDLKNSEEGPYIERSLRHCFPNARFIPYPYCGHSITRYLLDVGLLKSTTLGFCEGIAFPEFDRKLRGKSPEYLRNVAKLNFAAGRKRWALALLARAMELGNNPERTEALRLRIDPPPPVIVEPPPPPPPPPKRASPLVRIRKWFVRRILHLGPAPKRKKKRGGKSAKKAGK
jgi:hypothetical protein